MKYTVLLLYPDYTTDNFGQDTYMTSVEADSVIDAQASAQMLAADGHCENPKPEDFFVLMVIEGEHQDIKE